MLFIVNFMFLMAEKILTGKVIIPTKHKYKTIHEKPIKLFLV